MADHGPKRKVTSSLVALSSAAIMAVYAAGYVRTRRAAERFDFEATARRRVGEPPGAARAAAPKARPSAPEVAAPALPSVEAPPQTPSVVVAPRSRATPRPPSPTPIQTAPASDPSSTPRTVAASSKVEPGVVPPAQPSAQPFVQPSPPPAEEAMEGDEPVVSAPPPGDDYKDGTYTGWGSCRHGDVQVELVIRAGRIAWASISKCYTRYPCSLIDRLAPEVVGRQGPPITFVSGASESSDAFYYAVLDALSKAK